MQKQAPATEPRFTRTDEHPLEDLARRVPAVLFICDDGRPVYLSPRAQDLLGESPDRLVAEPWLWDRERGRLREVSTTIEQHGVQRTFGALVAADPARDPLTKLPGRALLREHVELAVARARQQDGHVALLHVGIGGLDLVAAGLGRSAHDDAVRTVASRVRRELPDTAMVAAPADGELAVMLADLDGGAHQVAETAAAQVIEVVAQPVRVGDEEFELGARVGVSVLPRDANDAEAALRHAEAAMREARRTDGASVVFYEGDTSEAVERLLVTARLRRAVDNGELKLHYQPIVALDTGRVVAVEALLRWEDPERGLVPPLSFIPVAEYTGLIEPIGRWVIDACCAQAAAWGDEGLDTAISFNVSLRQFRDGHFADVLAERIAGAGLDPKRFIVEITETVAMRDPACVSPMLERLRDIGVRVAIDDFGAGHSSLARLRELDVDMLKIDRAFLDFAPADTRAARLVSAAIDLAAALDTIAVVEGVESEEQRRFLRERGCTLAQGFHLSRPLPADETTELLRASAAG